MLGFLPKDIIIPEQETSDVLDPGAPLQVDGPMATFFETKKKWSASKLCLKPLPDCGSYQEHPIQGQMSFLAIASLHYC